MAGDTTPKRVTVRRGRRGLGNEQKAGFVFVTVTGVLAVILGGFYLARHVGAPLDFFYEGPRVLSGEQERQLEMEKQQRTDTDGDLISDYDELYVLRTSPYLKDTDGDGFSDYQELTSGNDPTCKDGNDCESSLYVNPYEQGDGANFSFIHQAGDTSVAASDVVPVMDSPDPEEVLKQFQNLQPDQVRELLISSGAEEADINALSDEELMELYQAVLEDLESSGRLQEIAEASSAAESGQEETSSGE